MIYLLSRKENVGYDEFAAKVIRAGSEKEARKIANESTGDEGAIWRDETKVSSEPIFQVGKSGEILGSFNAG